MNKLSKFLIAYENWNDNYNNDLKTTVVKEEFAKKLIENGFDKQFVIAKKGSFLEKFLEDNDWYISNDKKVTDKTYEIINIKKEKSIIEFKKENGDLGYYDFKDKSCKTIKKEKNGKIVTRNVKTLNSFLKGYRIINLYAEDKTYKKFLKWIQQFETNLSSINSLLKKMGEYSFLEQMLLYPELKVKMNYRVTSSGAKKIDKHNSPTKPLKDYNKNFIKFMVKNDIALSKNIETFYFNHNENSLPMKILYYLFENDEREELKNLIRKAIEIDDNSEREYGYCRNERGNINYIFKWDLLKEININPKAFCDYIYYLIDIEKFTLESALREVQDYYNMIYKMSVGTNAKIRNKYPKNLLTIINITSKNYNRFKREYNDELFAIETNKRSYKRLEYENEDKTIKVIRPLKPQDIKDEAVQQANCVASYIDRVMEGRTRILFIRRTDEIDKSYITMEVNQNGEMIQAYGACNRKPDAEGLAFIREYCKEKGLKQKQWR